MNNTQPITSYRNDLLTFLTPLEGFRQDPYFDTKGIVTIGYGFNIETNPAARLLVLNQLGLFAGRTDLEIANISEDFRLLISGVATGDTILLVNALNAKVRDYLGAQTTTIFTLDQTQSTTIFNQILGDATTGHTVIGQSMLIPGKQAKLDAILGNSVPRDTKEYVALMSLFYNAESLVGLGSKLATAVINDDRAEAWYQIRYQSNSDGQHTGRRIEESELFSLYDNPGQGVSEAEAREVLRMYTIHQPEIQEYESRFSTLFPTGGTDTVVFQIIGAKTTLIPIYNAGKFIDGEVLVGNEFSNTLDEYGRLVLDKNDLLFGEGGNDYLYGHGGEDVLYGGAGEDRLYGGAGDDRLEGGEGFDTYRWSTGDGHDRIEDSDADGVIFVNGQMLAGGVKKVGHTDWISPDGTIKYEMSGTDLVVKLNGTTILTVNENFQSGQFGISLIDAPSIATDAPATTRTIVGDFQPLDTDLVEAGVQIGFDDLGNVIQDPLSPGDRSDILNGSGNNDQMNGGALRDRLTALGGSDILTGGSDNDVLIGQDGNDQLFADELVNVSSLVSFENFGGTGGTGAQGDFLTGGTNDDVLVSGAGNDALYGGTGKDLILGGAGNDVIDGDDDFVATDFGWSYTFSGPLSYTLLNAVKPSDGTVVGDDDALYGGAGNDVMFGKKGKDLLYGEAGNDTITGGDGDDVVLGGADNDSVFGDDFGTTGNDYVDGGDGDDVVVGAFGDDTVIGGLGNDILYGEAVNLPGIVGNDILDGGDGNDELNGTGGSDVLFGGAGHDVLRGDFLGDPVPGDDFLYGDAGNDILRGEAGNDSLDGGDGDDELQGNQGSDVLSGGTGVDTMFGQQGEDTLFGDEGDDFLYGDSDGLDPGIGANDVLDGGAGNDQLLGDGGDDQLFGEEGDDQLYGGAGNDVLEGGVGNDSLSGGGGSDTYLFHLGDGTDTIDDAIGQGNRLVFGQGIGSESVTLGIGTGDTLIVRAGNAGDAVRITGFSVNFPEAFHPIDSFEFADGTALTYSQLVQRGFQLFGTSSDESLVGTGFADRIAAGSGNDVVSGLVGADTLLGEDGADVLQGGAGDDILEGGAGNDQLRGEDGADVLYGGAGDDLLTADVGPDQLVGGDGHDTYVLSLAGHEIVEFANAGVDTVKIGLPGSFTFVLPMEVENIDLVDDMIFPGDRVDFVGNQLANQMTGSDLLDGQQGNDTLIGLGNNIYVFGRGYGQDVIQTGLQAYASGGFVDYIQLLSGVAPTDVTLEGQGNHLVMKIAGTTDQITVENYLLPTPTVGEIRFDDGTVWDQSDIASRVQVITGTNGNDILIGLGNDNDIFGLAGNDELIGYGGVDRLDGGAGDDILVGGDGNDIYLFGRGGGQDVVNDFPDIQNSGEVDTVLLDSTITPGDIRLQATPDLGLLLTINGTADQLLVQSYFLHPVYQIEQIKFADGTIWDAAAIASRTEGLTLVGTEGPDVLTGIFANDTLSGLGGDDTLTGGAGNDLLDGGSGADTLVGGTGNDLYIVDNPGDVVTEQGNQGTDTVQSHITYTLGANVEHLTLTGTTAINGTGNSGSNTLTGNSAANTLAGGTGNDTYIVGAGDTVTEAASAGTDTVQSSVSWALGSNVENLTLTGTGAINGTGNTLNNSLTGNAGNNILDGGTGNDTMVGGAGDDTFVVNATGDVVTEQANEGIDTVLSAVTRTLGTNFERLTLTGTTAINGTGNTLDNVLTGNSAANTLTGAAGNDTLDGGVGNDTMVGGTGNDTYVVNATGDVVTEQTNEGTDTVLSAVTRTLGTNFERLTLTGTTAINGTGNTLDNVLTGNSAANVLTGGAGNDTYVVGTGDTVTEAASAGTDTVQSAVTWTLGANLENVTLTGTAAINGTGNTLNNVFTGNSANNVLTGLGGNDTYHYSRGGGQDTIIDNSGTSDTMLFGATINPLDLVISRQANDLRLAIHGSTDQVTIQNWYSGTTNQTETVQAGNGQTLLSTQVDQLIQAMAGFTAQTGLTWDQAIDQQPTQVQTVLAASWQ